LQTVRHRFKICTSSFLLCCLGAMLQRWVPPTRYTLRRNTTSIMKGLVLVWYIIALYLLYIVYMAK